MYSRVVANTLQNHANLVLFSEYLTTLLLIILSSFVHQLLYYQ